MKKIIILFFVVLALLTTSSITAFALGNDFTFSPAWYDGVLNNSLFSYTKVEYNGNTGNESIVSEGSDLEISDLHNAYILNSYVRLNGNLVGSNASPNKYVYFEYGDSYKGQVAPSEGFKVVEFDSPVSVTVEPNQTFNFQVLFLIKHHPSNSNYSGYEYEINIRDIIRLIDKNDHIYTLSNSNETNKKESLYYKDVELGHLQYSSSSSIHGTWVTDNTYEGHLINCSWTNNTDSSITLKSIHSRFNRLISTSWLIPGFLYGFISQNSDNSVVLPSYVEENLIDIKNELLSQSSDFKTLLRELDDLQIQIDELIAAQSSSSSLINNYYQTITVPTEQQVIKQAELSQAVADAKHQLEEMKEVMTSVKVPTAQDVFTATNSTQTQVSIDEALNNTDINNILKSLFDNSIIVTMLLSVISIATVGYILFGKR